MHFLSSLLVPLALSLLSSSTVALGGPSQPGLSKFKFEKRSEEASSLSSSTSESIYPSSGVYELVSSSPIVDHSTTSEATATDTSNLARASSTVQPHSTSSIESASAPVANGNASVVPPVVPPVKPDNSAIIVVLQLAFVLEVLEFEFYKLGLSRFGHQQFVDAGFSPEQSSIIIESLQSIVLHEGAHVTIIEETIIALGGSPFKGCGFAFEAALVNPQTFLATARTLEVVGVGAYSGAAHLLTEPQIATAAVSILAIEARHSSLLNTLTGGSFTPQSFDLSLNVQSVLALAGGFLQGCTPADLGFTANEPLSIVETQFGSTRFAIGSQLFFEVSIEVDITVLFCQMFIAGSPAAIVFPAQSCHIPEGINGPVAVYLTNTSTPLATNIIVQNTVQIVAGPGLIFVDSQSSLISSLFSPTLNSGYSSLASIDCGGYWIAKRRGGEAWAKVQLVKNGHLGKRHLAGSHESSKRFDRRRKTRRSLPDAQVE